MEEVTILPNAYVPIVLNPKFEFVPFESNSRKSIVEGHTQLENGHNMQTIDVHNLTHAQTREPPKRVSEFLRDDGSKNGINLLLDVDKKELINFLMTKIFCVS